MDFRILGPVEARLDGRTLELGGSRQRALLALLLLARGAPVSRDRLVEELWSGDSSGRVKSLHVAVSRLRRALVEQTRLATTPDGYRLLLEPGELDLDRFAASCDEGRRALAAGEPARASARLRAAMQEWRGPPLAGVAFEPFAQAEAVTLEAQQAAALEDRIEADLMCGGHAELVAELEVLVARHPLRERLRGQLMRALYRAGRQGDALAVYRETVQALDAELGLRPSPELEQLERAILVHDPNLSRGSAGAEAPAVTRRRATATILFTDIVGSTTMRATLGDEQSEAIRREHDRRILARVVEDVVVHVVHDVGDAESRADESAARNRCNAGTPAGVVQTSLADDSAMPRQVDLGAFRGWRTRPRSGDRRQR